MEGEDDMDSLFAGMEFVNPLDAESPLPPPLDLTSHADQIQLSGELAADPKPEGSDKAKIGSINSIVAVYDSASTKVQPSLVSWPSVHKQSLDASKPGVRRKRRSVKIGYGRSAPDDADANGQDETASNGSAIDEHSLQLLELISAHQDVVSASGRELLVSSEISNGDLHVISLTAVDSEHEDPFESHNVFAEQLEILEAELPKSNDASHVYSSADKVLDTKESGLNVGSEVVQLREVESGNVMVLRKENPEDSFSPPNECLCVDNMDNDFDVSLPQTASSERASDFARQEKHSDDIDLKIKVPFHLSIEERLSFIKTAVAMNAECIQQMVATISQSKKAAAQKRRHIGEIVTRSTLEFKEVEEEIQAACEREDFEKAEQLDEALVLAQRAKEAAMEEFIAAETEYDNYASKMHEAVQLLITNEEQGFLLLEQLGQEAVDMAKHKAKDSEDDVKTKTEKLLAKEVTVKLEKEKLMLEVQKVEDAKMELSCTIESSVLEDSGEKQMLEDERHVLLQELDALLAAVRLKETQIAEHDKKIEELEQKIHNRVTGLEQEKVKLEAAFHELTSDLDNLNKEKESLDERKKQVEAEGTSAQEAAEKLLELSSIAKAEAQKLQDALIVRKSAAKIAISSKEKMLSLASQEKQHVEDANSLRDRLSSFRTALQELASEKAKLQQESLSANQQISSIEKRLPELESEKKLAAGSRNFKEAGRLAAEAKALLSDKEKIMTESKNATKQLQVLEQELESRARDLTEMECQLQLKEKEAAKARYERLRLLAAATRDERDTASELEDLEEAKSLDVEAAAADKEADEIQKEFDFEVMCVE